MKPELQFIPGENLQVAGDYDVLVVGGGVAGIGAALAAARSGCKTLIIEKGVYLGGLATLGLVAIYLPLCDGYGRKIIGGIAEELLHVSIKYGYNTLAPEWKKGVERVSNPTSRYTTKFAPYEFVLAIDELIESEGIDVRFDTLFSAPIIENGRCVGVVVDEKGGRKVYRGKMVVDASGDADVLYRAGVPCRIGDNWMVYWAIVTNLSMMRDAVEKNDILKALDLHWWGRIPKPEEMAATKSYQVNDAQSITEFVLSGRKSMKKDMEGKTANEFSIMSIPGMPQLRTSRRIEGKYLLTEDDKFKHFEDSIGAVCDWRRPGPLYEIPYRTLISDSMPNIIAAGRIISSTGDAWEITRVIPPAALTGQAAGLAASQAIKNGTSLQEISVPALQQSLADDGVLIHF